MYSFHKYYILRSSEYYCIVLLQVVHSYITFARSLFTGNGTSYLVPGTITYTRQHTVQLVLYSCTIRLAVVLYNSERVLQYQLYSTCSTGEVIHVDSIVEGNTMFKRQN